MEKRQKRTERETLKWVLRRLYRYRVRIGWITVSFLLLTVLSFFRPLIIRQITDEGMLNQNMAVIAGASLFLLVLALIEQGLELVQTRMFLKLRNQTQYQLFREVFERLLHLKVSYFEERNSSEIMSTLNADVMNVSGVADRSVMFLFSYILRMVSGFVGLLVISWKLALLVLLVVPLKYLIVRTLAARKKMLMEQVMEQVRDFSGWFGDTLNGIREVKLWNLYGQTLAVFKEKQERMIERDEALAMNDAWNMSLELLLEWGLQAVLYICGGVLLCRGELTIGSVFSFLSYSAYVTGPIAAIFNMKLIFARILPAAGRLLEFLGLETETEVLSDGRAELCPGTLELSGVCFSYGEREVLKGVDLVLHPGERVAVIGANGSGKSTILNLLLRFLEPASGEIRLDGRRIGELPLAQYRELFSVVSQEPYLFQMTAEENINLKGNLTEAEIREACRKSGADTFLKTIDRITGQNGAKLSGGEKQKLAIARAIGKDAPIVLLDEANSGFDPQSDRYLAQIIREEFRGKTILMITHRYENLKEFDRVYRLVDGGLVESGQEE